MRKISITLTVLNFFLAGINTMAGVFNLINDKPAITSFSVAAFSLIAGLITLNSLLKGVKS